MLVEDCCNIDLPRKNYCSKTACVISVIFKKIKILTFTDRLHVYHKKISETDKTQDRLHASLEKQMLSFSGL